jgi:hypothetical protein
MGVLSRDYNNQKQLSRLTRERFLFCLQIVAFGVWRIVGQQREERNENDFHVTTGFFHVIFFPLKPIMSIKKNSLHSKRERKDLKISKYKIRS